MYDSPGETTGYPYPRPFQPQGAAQWKKPLAKPKKRVIGKTAKAKKPIVKKK